MTSPTSALFFEDLHVGLAIDSEPRTVSADDAIRFATEFDPQPQHISAEAARHSMFGELVLSGWHTASLTMRMQYDAVLSRFPGGTLGAQVDTLAWRRPVRPGEPLRARVEVLALRESRSRPDRGLVTIRTSTLDANGAAVMQMEATVMVPRRPA